MTNLPIKTLNLLKSGRTFFSAEEAEQMALADDELDHVARRDGSGMYRLVPGGRVLLARLAMLRGMHPSTLAPLLSWREFEAFTAFSLQDTGYGIRRDHHFGSNPRAMQLDVIAVKGRRILVIDCKKWRNLSGIRKAARNHVERVRAAAMSMRTLLGRDMTEATAFPVIVCLLTERPTVEECFLVDIVRLRSFLELSEGGLFDDMGVTLS